MGQIQRIGSVADKLDNGVLKPAGSVGECFAKIQQRSNGAGNGLRIPPRQRGSFRHQGHAHHNQPGSNRQP